ncbi:hypothetical protein ACJ41O_009107 [Fusarium nematophilum]
MRLLNAETFQLEQFYDQDIPDYAILSHTWTKDEVSFQEFSAISRNDPRLSKTVGCCRRALGDGLKYVWVDTFCIDKTSSAELSEAINSMYQWYKNSNICYVYLSDVHPGDGDEDGPGPAFRESRWFTRGWTLQELLAPDIVEFFDSSWYSIGLKCEWPAKTIHRRLGGLNGSLSGIVADITSISSLVLRGVVGTQTLSVAERMSWAARRETTRPEDEAYSLFGIFSINMPLLYGEGGQRAFFRLQEEIMRQTHDHSIFSWGFGLGPTHDGILADSPAEFACCGDLVVSGVGPRGRRSHYTVTNLGVQIQIPVVTVENGTRYGLFNATRREAWDRCLALPLRRVEGTSENEDILTRAACGMPIFLPDTWFAKATRKQLYLANKPAADVRGGQQGYDIHIPQELIDHGYRPTEMHPNAALPYRPAEDSKTIYFGPWRPDEERWALIRYGSDGYPAFDLKAMFNRDTGIRIGLLRLCPDEDMLFTVLESPGDDAESEASNESWQQVIYLGPALGYLLVETERSTEGIGIDCILSLIPWGPPAIESDGTDGPMAGLSLEETE